MLNSFFSIVVITLTRAGVIRFDPRLLEGSVSIGGRSSALTRDVSAETTLLLKDYDIGHACCARGWRIPRWMKLVTGVVLLLHFRFYVSLT